MNRLASVFIFSVLIGVSAYADDAIPPNTINCAQFKKTGSGWEEVGTAVFDIGGVKHMSLSGSTITPNAFNVGGADLFDVLEKKCGSH